VALSLQTHGFRLAEALAEEIDAAFERFFEAIRMIAFDVGEQDYRLRAETRFQSLSWLFDTEYDGVLNSPR
jgi:hypothetical protein